MGARGSWWRGCGAARARRSIAPSRSTRTGSTASSFTCAAGAISPTTCSRRPSSCSPDTHCACCPRPISPRGSSPSPATRGARRCAGSVPVTGRWPRCSILRIRRQVIPSAPPSRRWRWPPRTRAGLAPRRTAGDDPPGRLRRAILRAGRRRARHPPRRLPQAPRTRPRRAGAPPGRRRRSARHLCRFSTRRRAMSAPDHPGNQPGHGAPGDDLLAAVAALAAPALDELAAERIRRAAPRRARRGSGPPRPPRHQRAPPALVTRRHAGAGGGDGLRLLRLGRARRRGALSLKPGTTGETHYPSACPPPSSSSSSTSSVFQYDASATPRNGSHSRYAMRPPGARKVGVHLGRSGGRRSAMPA